MRWRRLCAFIAVLMSPTDAFSMAFSSHVRTLRTCRQSTSAGRGVVATADQQTAPPDSFEEWVQIMRKENDAQCVRSQSLFTTCENGTNGSGNDGDGIFGELNNEKDAADDIRDLAKNYKNMKIC